MRILFAIVVMVLLAAPAVANPSADNPPRIHPGSLLQAPSNSAVGVGIAQAEYQRRDSADIGGSAEAAGGDATGHIVSGPNKSTTFKARHYSGSIHHSSYQQLPWEGVIWHHIEWGPNKSLYETN